MDLNNLDISNTTQNSGTPFYLKGIDFQARANIGIASGTSIDYVLNMLCKVKKNASGSERARAHNLCV